jgi:PAS domain S-box-containing protein
MGFETKNRILNKIKGYYFHFAPTGVTDQENQNHLQEQVLYGFVVLSLIVSFAVFLSNIPEIIKNQFWVLLIIDTIGYFSCLGVFIFRNLPYKVRAIWICAFFYGIGIAIVYSVGPFLASREWLFAFCLISSIFLGWRGAVIALTLNGVTLIVLGFLVDYGFWRGAGGIEYTLEGWVRVAADMFFLTIVVTFFVTYIFNKLKQSVQKNKEYSILLLEEKSDLEQSRKKLEKEIKERIVAQNELRDTREKERRILDSVAAGIIVVERDTRKIVFANSTALSFFGVHENFLIGKICHGYICPAELDKCPIIDLGQQHNFSEKELLTATGATLPILKTVVPIEFQGNDCLLETFIDISERKRLESQLAQYQKMQALGTLAGGIAHDFNNILAAIMGNTELVLMDADPSRRGYRNLLEIKSASLRARDLVKQILSFSRQTSVDQKPTGLDSIILEGLEIIRATLPKSIRIETSLTPNIGLVNADSTQVHQVLINLCSNATDAMSGQDGTLKIELNTIMTDEPIMCVQGNLPPGNYVVLSVVDNGKGIAPENIQRIFEPFFTTKEVGKGTGMGLAVVHGIMESHNGGVAIESVVGQGVRFNCYFPVFLGAVDPVKDDADILVSPGSGSILFVDDEEMIVEYSKALLEKFGYRVTAFVSSQDALDAFAETPDNFDLVITDMSMPGLNGADLAGKIRKIRPEVPIILSTGYRDAALRDKILTAGVSYLLDKPINVGQLMQTINRLIEKS